MDKLNFKHMAVAELGVDNIDHGKSMTINVENNLPFFVVPLIEQEANKISRSLMTILVVIPSTGICILIIIIIIFFRKKISKTLMLLYTNKKNKSSKTEIIMKPTTDNN